MKGRMNDAELAKLIASLPYYTPPAGFNRRVLAGLALAPQPALSAAGGAAPAAAEAGSPPPRWLLWAERAAGTAAACWLGAAVFFALFLAVSYKDNILPVLAEPRVFLSGLKLYALRAGFFALDLLRFLSIGKAVLADKAGGLYLLPRLALSAALAGSVILALSGRPSYARSGATRR